MSFVSAIDEDTGMPEIPWEGCFWRFRRIFGGSYALELRTKTWYGSRPVLGYPFMYSDMVTKHRIREAARSLIRSVEAQKEVHDMLGDYPPMRME